MSTKIGGPHRCNIHPDFPETDDTEEFNKHCLETEGHSTTGVLTCDCGTEINFSGITFQPIGKDTKLKCPDCYGKQEDLQRMVMNSYQQQQQTGEGGNTQQ